ncbi:tripartite tricarboxylate transporter substrate binding protein [Variovorax guangxiensis]|uniref:tripartite tricarboxylate transporter substrate binding protein n=1 Tax=Variovorax guangxiensis TaxID=1775474 RepID=UPI0028598060|nr:tripartite tricarboxylate transporter substrate binding protein [Variovorax guangxiensis]MDR6858596.1 tripartite-type tricarboxylate transporter receptor subunit TctC [Variovorax guangxiensis]
MNCHSVSSSRRNFLLSAAAASLLPHSSFAQAPAWPTRAVKIVVGTGPGSGTDTITRLLAPRLEEIWKQPVVVENKVGAGGIIGTEYVLAANDGHTLLMASPSMLLAKYTTRNLRFDPLTDLTPVYRVFNTPVVFVTNAKTAQRAKTMAELVALSKSSPQGIFFSGAGRASFFNVSMAALAKPMGLRYSAVDFNGMGPLTLALLRDDTQLALSGHLAVKGQIDSKELHALAVVDSKRLTALPDVPTLEEAVGYKGFLPISWGGIFAPKTTPAAVIDFIARAFGTLYADEPARKSLEARLSGTLIQSSPALFAKEYAEEANVWKNTFATLGIAPE